MSTVLNPSQPVLEFWAATDVGRVRRINQDCYLVDPHLQLAIVADGVGGRKRGEVAAGLACRTVNAHLNRHSAKIWNYQSSPGISEQHAVQHLVRQAVQYASSQVFLAGKTLAAGVGMSTTMEVVLVVSGTAFIAHVGDSRTYLIRNRKAYALTEDHSVLQEKVRRGLLTEKAARTAKGRNILTRAVGSMPTVKVDTLTIKLQPGDGMLLCSDGITRYFEEEELPRALPNFTSIGVENLVNLAVARGGVDNTTALVIGVHEGSAHNPDSGGMDTEDLRRFPMFEQCTSAELKSLCSLLELVSFEAGQTVFSEGDPSDGFYLLSSGKITLTRGGTPLASLGAGEPFGEMAFVSEDQRTTTAIATRQSTAYVLRKHRFAQIFREGRPLATHLLWRMFRNAVHIIRRQNIQISDNQ
jgi:PPM family protein phosphatase